MPSLGARGDTASHVPHAASPVAATLATLPPGVLLRLEGVALCGIAVLLYGWLGGGWWWFAVLLLVPDVGLLGYLLGPRHGARLYNLTHTLVVPAVLGAVGLGLGAPTAVLLALVWAAHIGMDRALGYGLKYPGAFADTHLQRVAGP